MIADSGIGRSVARLEDERFLAGGHNYVDDIKVADALHVAFVRSPHAHAIVKEVELKDAAACPGVAAVFTAMDLPPRQKGSLFPSQQLWPLHPMAADRVRFVGEIVAAVVASTRYIAEDAAQLVSVDYQPLQAVVDLDAAMAQESPRLFEDMASNRYRSREATHGDLQVAFDNADIVIQERFRSGRQYAAPIEPRSYLASYDEATATLTLWSSTQIPHLVRDGLSELLAVSADTVRVIAPDVGGGFGEKAHLFPEEILVAQFARQLQRPVKWVADRTEDFLASIHAREGVYDVALAATRDGTILGLRAHVICAAGAYSVWPFTAFMESAGAAELLPGAYRIPNYSAIATPVYTNTCPIGAYRGVIAPACTFVIESLLDRLAAAAGIDPAEVRLKNMVDYPEETRYSYFGKSPPLDAAGSREGSLKELMRMALEAADYERMRAEQQESFAEGRYIGIGIANVLEPTGLPSSKANYIPGAKLSRLPDGATVQLEGDGSVTVYVSTCSQGQGHETTWAQVAAEELGLLVKDIGVRLGDTATTPFGIGTFASRSAVIGGGALIKACREFKSQAVRVAARVLECKEREVSVVDGGFSSRGGERELTWAQLAVALKNELGLTAKQAPLLAATDFYDPKTTSPGQASHVAVVEVDPRTGQVLLLKLVIAEDCGVMINPMTVDGQIQGGAAQGIGNALYEKVVYDEDGQLLSASFLDYFVPRASEIPDVRIVHRVAPSPYTIRGFKGVGESAVIGAPAAIANAVNNALRPLGVRLAEIPITPQRVFEAANPPTRKSERSFSERSF